MKSSIKQQRKTILVTFLISFGLFTSCASLKIEDPWTVRLINGEVRIRSAQRNEDFSPREFFLAKMEAECVENIESKSCHGFLMTRKGTRSLLREFNSLRQQLRECKQRDVN